MVRVVTMTCSSPPQRVGATEPIGTACRAELRRIGHALHAANPHEDFAALEVEIAEMDPTHADWRAIILEMAWYGIGAPTS